jgi:hypothetical protein
MKGFLLAILFLPAMSRAQSPMFGLFSNHYLETTGSQGSLRRVDKPVSIIYNQEYCWLYLRDGDVISFKTRSYIKNTNSSTKSIHESFVNQDSRTTTDGFYHIMVDRMNDGTTFQISTPAGTIVVKKAEVFSENGQVKSGAMKIDWAAVRAGELRADSASKHLLSATERTHRDSVVSVLQGYNLFVDPQSNTKTLEEKMKDWKIDSARRTAKP